MIFNLNVELDTNIYNTPFPLRNLILDCYRNVFQSLIISINHSMHFRYLSNAIKSNGGCFSSFKYNHLPHLHMVTHRHSLKIINKDYLGEWAIAAHGMYESHEGSLVLI